LNHQHVLSDDNAALLFQLIIVHCFVIELLKYAQNHIILLSLSSLLLFSKLLNSTNNIKIKEQNTKNVRQ